MTLSDLAVRKFRAARKLQQRGTSAGQGTRSKVVMFKKKRVRPRPESNRRTGICSPLHGHSATGPEQGAWRALRPGPCQEGAEISLRGSIGSRLGTVARRGVAADIDLDEKDDRPIDQPLAGMLEIDRDSVADGRLHLSQPPGRKIGMADIHARNQPAAHGTPLLLQDWQMSRSLV